MFPETLAVCCCHGNWLFFSLCWELLVTKVVNTLVRATRSNWSFSHIITTLHPLARLPLVGGDHLGNKAFWNTLKTCLGAVWAPITNLTLTITHSALGLRLLLMTSTTYTAHTNAFPCNFTALLILQCIVRSMSAAVPHTTECLPFHYSLGNGTLSDNLEANEIT